MAQPVLQPQEAGMWADGRRVGLNDAATFDEVAFNVENENRAQPYAAWQVGRLHDAQGASVLEYFLVWMADRRTIPVWLQAFVQGYAGVANTDYFEVWMDVSTDQTWAEYETLGGIPKVQDNALLEGTWYEETTFTRDIYAGESVRIRVIMVGDPYATGGIPQFDRALHVEVRLMAGHAGGRDG